jgi:DNA-binding winged helix-turn-helix (wHTH) protein
MNGVPVPNHGEDEQQEGDQQQAESFRGIDRVPLLLVGGIVLASNVRHHSIVRSAQSRAQLGATLRVVGRCPSPMPASPGNRSGRIARFGVFELDLAAGELRKNGAKLRLQDQPFQVLALLLERAGDVVTRDDLRQKLWPADTFVDFDHSLNTAVNKLRETLGDSASSPRYIETLARRGYRFIAPVQKVGKEDVETDHVGTGAFESLPRAESRGSAERSEAPAPPAAPEVFHPELEVPIPRRGLTRGLFALAQLMYLIFYVVALFRLHALQGIADSVFSGWLATALVAAVMVTAGVGIPLRCYLLSAVGFDYQRLGEKFQQMFPFILALDQLWAVAPFLLAEKIGLGAAFAASAALLYVPFSERTLIRLAYLGQRART